MSANRKLLAEIQQVLKKVEEGIELFEEIWDKVYAAEQQSLKEKYETDLKKEIKKLQRLRDQIKSWISGNDIKDKTQLIEARKNIETKMEQFKICEKDTKTKAYSKEGLAREAKVDPKDALKEEKRSWLNDCIDKLNDLINSIELEKEKLTSGRGKNKNKDQLEKIENRIQKNKWHIARLELIIKLMDSGDLDPSSLEAIADNLDYYIESAEDDDGALGVDDEFDIYEELELDELGGSATFELQTHANASSKEDSTPTDSSKGDQSDTAVDNSDQTRSKKSIASTPAKSSASLKLSSPAAAAAAISGKGSNLTAKSSSTSSAKASKPPQQAKEEPVPDDGGSKKAASSSGGEAKTPSTTGEEASDPKSNTSSASNSMSWATAAATIADGSASNTPASDKITGTKTDKPNLVSATTESNGTGEVSLASADKAPESNDTVLDANNPQSSSQPLSSSVPAETEANLTPELMATLRQLNNSMFYSPETLELEKTSKNYYGNAHSSFPTSSMFTDEAESTALFEKLPMDTLFFIFYFQQGTYQQYLAAKQLKKHSWRFHKKYMTWFQRHEEPKVATEEFEEGTYVYFDYESGWCQRIKAEFKFEYAYLEDELGGN